MKDTMISVFKPFRPIHYGITGLLALALLFRFISAAPNWIHYDENYYLNIAQNYIDRGELTPYMWRLDEGTNIIAGSGSGYGILVLTNWMKLFGVSLFGGRVLMILVGLATAGVMYHVGRLWWNSRAAGVVALGFALVGTSPFYSYVIRMDSLGMLAYSLVLLLHVYAVRRQKKRLHFWVGVGVVAAAEFHILSTLYLVALTLYYLIRYGQELLARRRLVLDTGPVYFGLGGLMAGLIYVAVHILPDPQSYFAISSQCFQCEPDILNKEFLRLARFMLLRSVEFALLVAALMSAYFRRQADDRHYLLLTLGWLLAQALIGTPPFTHYTYHIWPLVAVGTAGFITRGVRAGGQLSPRRLRFGLALAAFTLVLNLGLSLLGRQPFELRYDTEITPPGRLCAGAYRPADRDCRPSYLLLWAARLCQLPVAGRYRQPGSARRPEQNRLSQHLSTAGHRGG
jgi:hypothetical protein